MWSKAELQGCLGVWECSFFLSFSFFSVQAVHTNALIWIRNRCIQYESALIFVQLVLILYLTDQFVSLFGASQMETKISSACLNLLFFLTEQKDRQKFPL